MGRGGRATVWISWTITGASPERWAGCELSSWREHSLSTSTRSFSTLPLRFPAWRSSATTPAHSWATARSSKPAWYSAVPIETRGSELGAKRGGMASSAALFAEEFREAAFAEPDFFDAVPDAEAFLRFFRAPGAGVLRFARLPGPGVFLARLAAREASFLLAEDGLGMAVVFRVDESHDGADQRQAVRGAEKVATARATNAGVPQVCRCGRWDESDTAEHGGSS